MRRGNIEAVKSGNAWLITEYARNGSVRTRKFSRELPEEFATLSEDEYKSLTPAARCLLELKLGPRVRDSRIVIQDGQLCEIDEIGCLKIARVTALYAPFLPYRLITRQVRERTGENIHERKHTKQENQPPARNCKRCGAEFVASSPRQHFCVREMCIKARRRAAGREKASRARGVRPRGERRSNDFVFGRRNVFDE